MDVVDVHRNLLEKYLIIAQPAGGGTRRAAVSALLHKELDNAVGLLSSSGT
jgi:hypothetical protein